MNKAPGPFKKIILNTFEGSTVAHRFHTHFMSMGQVMGQLMFYLNTLSIDLICLVPLTRKDPQLNWEVVEVKNGFYDMYFWNCFTFSTPFPLYQGHSLPVLSCETLFRTKVSPFGNLVTKIAMSQKGLETCSLLSTCCQITL